MMAGKRVSACALVALLVGTGAASGQPRLTKEAIPKDLPSDIRVLLEECFAPGPSARGDAAKKLGELGAQASAAVPFLVSMLGDDESYMDSFKAGTMVLYGMSSPGRRAAVALGSIGSAAVEPLLRVLQEKEGPNRDKAALGLGLAKDPRAVVPLIEALADKEARLQGEAAEALGSLKDLRAVAPLIAALRDGDEAVSGKAHEALQELTAQKLGKDPAQWQEWWQSQKKQPLE
jgi:HEAT repeat protein